MQFKSKGLLLAAVSAVSLVSASHAMAAATPTTWTGTNSDVWTDPGNWSAGVPQTGYAANFVDSGNGNTSITLGGAAQPINTVAFTGTPAAFTIGTTAGDALNFDAGGAISMASTVTANENIAAGIDINATSGITLSNLGTSTLDLTGAISGGATGVTAITIASTTTNTTSDILFSGTNTYLGNTSITAKAVNIEVGSDSAFGAGTLIANTTNANPIMAYGGNHTISNAVTLTDGLTFGTDGSSNLTLAGPITQNSVQGRTLTFDNFGTAVYLGASKDSSTLTLNIDPSAASPNPYNLTFTTTQGTIPGSNPTATGSAILVLNDVIQDGLPGTHPGVVTFNPPSSGTENEGDIIVNGDNTYSGGTTFTTQNASTNQLTMQIGVSSSVNAGVIASGPFGTGAITFSDSNEPPILEPRGADQTVANPLTVTAGFFVESAPTTGTGVMVDPAGTLHNLYLTGAITGDTGRTFTNNMQPGAALYFGSPTTSAVFTLTSGATRIQSQQTALINGTTFIYDQLTGAGSLTAQVGGTVNIMATNNNYTGGTSVIGSGTGSTAVGTGATLGGTGYIPGTVTIGSATAASQGGIIAPGVAGPGTLNVASMILEPYGRYAFDYNATTGTVGGGVNDLISGSGMLDLTALSSTTPFDLNLNPVVTGSGATAYILADFAGGIINTGTAYANGTDVTDLFTFSGTASFTPDVLVEADGTGGQELELTATSVPEPASLGLVALGAIGFVKRRRK